MKKLVIISSQAFSLVNFRGPLIKALVKKNIIVYALAPDYEHESRLAVQNLGAFPIDFTLARTGMNPWRDVVDLYGLTLLVRSLKPEIILSYFAKPVVYGTIAAWLARVPYRVAMIEGLGYVFTTSEVVTSWKRVLLRRIVTHLYRFALDRAHRVIFLNNDDVSEFVANRVVEIAKVSMLGGIGVDLNVWRAVSIVETPITFIMIARLLVEKGIVEYVKAARIIRARSPDVRFVLLGGLDPNPGALNEAQVLAWVNEGVIDWPGHVPVQNWLAQASVFVLPSYREGVPRSTQEAMAMGLPVITTEAPGCRETVQHGVNGYLVPVQDVTALAEAMMRFVENRGLISKMGKESRRIAEEQFDVHKINGRILDILGVS